MNLSIVNHISSSQQRTSTKTQSIKYESYPDTSEFQIYMHQYTFHLINSIINAYNIGSNSRSCLFFSKLCTEENIDKIPIKRKNIIKRIFLPKIQN
jgi:hypothetical protein